MKKKILFQPAGFSLNHIMSEQFIIIPEDLSSGEFKDFEDTRTTAITENHNYYIRTK